jgi:hypothetical protein
MINDNPISAFAKNKSEHDYVTAGELLTALKGDVFKTSAKQAPVLIHSTDEEGDIHALKVVYKCGNCNTLHFIAGDIKSNNIMLNENSVIYADYTHVNELYVSRGELIEILEKFISKNDADRKVDVTTSDDYSSFPLTEIFKCSSSYPSVHLCSGYFDKK